MDNQSVNENGLVHIVKIKSTVIIVPWPNIVTIDGKPQAVLTKRIHLSTKLII